MANHSVVILTIFFKWMFFFQSYFSFFERIQSYLITQKINKNRDNLLYESIFSQDQFMILLCILRFYITSYYDLLRLKRINIYFMYQVIIDNFAFYWNHNFFSFFTLFLLSYFIWIYIANIIKYVNYTCA